MAELRRKTKRFPSDLTDEEWTRIAALLPKPSLRGRKPSVDLLRGCPTRSATWRGTLVAGGCCRCISVRGNAVYWWFRRSVRRLLCRTIDDVAPMLGREAAAREASPTGGVLDSGTVKAPFAEVRGYDGGKRIVARKRHVALDADGRLLLVNLTPADVSDSAGAQAILDAPRSRAAARSRR